MDVKTSGQETLRVAARVLPLHLAQPQRNAQALIEDIQLMDKDGVDLVAYPELCLTGSTCGDLFVQDALIEATQQGIGTIVEASASLAITIVVGAPLRYDGELVNCAVVIRGGAIAGVVPKSDANALSDTHTLRWFGFPQHCGPMTVAGYSTTMDDLSTFAIAERSTQRCRVVVGDEYLDYLADFGGLDKPDESLVVMITANPAATSSSMRKQTAQSASEEGKVALVVVNAGAGESSTDASWDGQAWIVHRGTLVGESELYATNPSGVVATLEFKKNSKNARINNSTEDIRLMDLDDMDDDELMDDDLGFDDLDDLLDDASSVAVASTRFPFVPSDPGELAHLCEQAFKIQVYGLTQRMKAIGTPNLVIGVSGGLDSTLALLVCGAAMDQLSRPRSDILAFTMPGFATSDQTKSSALALMEATGTTFETIDIRSTATEMLTNLGHGAASGEELYDVTFENVQAGLRTDYLFRLANQRGGIVVGTGDLSELALGWCTYGVGDHMSHYSVNCGVPKTLIPHLIAWVASQSSFDATTTTVLDTIITQEISPELVPTKETEGLQSTEKTIGPYPLNDFFLYYFLRGVKPSRIAELAHQVWKDSQQGSWPPGTEEKAKVNYDLGTITAWLERFLKRFFSSQFKRSCVPDGPQVFPGVSLSPRGPWIMPSDVSPETWVRELLENPPSEEK